MKLILTLFISCCLLCVSACSQKPIAYDIEGHAVNLSDLKGKWIILNYWADWCEPCHQEIPQLNSFYQQHKNRDAVVLGINYDGLPTEQLQQLARKDNIRFPLLSSDPRNHWGLQEVTTLPSTFIISPDGNTVKKLLGGQTVKSLEMAMRDK